MAFHLSYLIQFWNNVSKSKNREAGNCLPRKFDTLKSEKSKKNLIELVHKSYRNEDGKPSAKHVERLGTLEDLEKRIGGETQGEVRAVKR